MHTWTFSACAPCTANGTKCDRQTPCNSCVQSNNANACVRERDRGTFPRGHGGYANELYPYISAMRGGPDGIDSVELYNCTFEQPGDFHLRYVDWVAGGALPFPPGFRLPLQYPARPPWTLRTLPLEIPLQQPAAPRSTITLPRHPRVVPQNARYVSIPPNDMALLRSLTRRRPEQLIESLSDIMRAGPPSPGPTFTFFNIDGLANLVDRVNLPLHDPRHISQARPHPNPRATPVLHTVQSVSNTPLLAEPANCSERNTWIARAKCDVRTHEHCEDLSHGGFAVPVCGACNSATRQVIGRALSTIARSLRAYACSNCAAQSVPGSFRDKRFKIWGFQEQAYALDDPPQDVGTASISLGRPQPITGCVCARKMIERVICTPHRVSHFLEMRDKANDMRNFVLATFGRMICPFCLDAVGADSYNFEDAQGNPNPKIVYTCMSCWGIVATTPEIHASF
ncbi:hypothetical protein F4803DRAFT_500709 [Xylaria telfairii]|nr:hypothetical protein F4803DRAFT_500709 [Xylaria telfairii]